MARVSEWIQAYVELGGLDAARAAMADRRSEPTAPAAACTVEPQAAVGRACDASDTPRG